MKKRKIKIGILNFTWVNNFKTVKALKQAYAVTEKLEEKIRAMGHVPIVYDLGKSQILVDGKKLNLMYDGKPFNRCDVLIPWVGIQSNLEKELPFLRAFELMGIPVLKTSDAVAKAKNKLTTMQILASAGILVPRSVVIRAAEYLNAAVKILGEFPLVMKTPYGTWGSGVALVESARSLKSVFSLFRVENMNNIIILQEFIKESAGMDIRAFVIGNKVVASMKRQAVAGDFRSNIHLGAEGKKVELTQAEKVLVVKATKLLGLEVAGVDFMRTKKGPMILEVNSNPGFAGIEKATGIDVQKLLIKFAISKIRN